MNKITKLLSVFVIAGAVSCGVAALAGCGSTPEAHTHNGTKHEAVAATCTQDGTKEYYTCDGADCAGKYFADEACTQEITDISVPATGHTEKFTDKGDGTHGITCEKGDLTETTEAHVDENGDNLCDKCSAKFFVAGKYYNLEVYSSDEEIEIKADGKIVYNDNEYTISVADDGEATFEVGSTIYTLTKTASGYRISYPYENLIKKKYYGKKSETETITDADAFIGTYTGELVYSDGYGTFKVTKIAITENWQVLFTQIKIGDAEGNPEQGVTYSSATTVLDNIIGDTLTNNDFATYYYHFIAQTVENNAVKSLNLVYYSEAALFTKVSGTTDEVVTSLPLDDFTYYVDADNNYSLAAYESFATKIYEINGASKRFIIKDADGNYIITFADSNNNDASLMLKIAADKQSIDVYTLDGATKVTTLALSTVEYPTIKFDGSVNNNAVVDPFNNNYAYYKIETAGWYKITAGENDVILYTDVDFETHTVGWDSVTVNAGKSKALQLAANSYIAVSSSYIGNGFTATYSENEPEPDYEAFTDGKYEIASFNSSNTYYVKGTVETAGKYYVSVVMTAKFDNNDRGAYFVIGDTKFGYEYSGGWAVAAGGLVYEATLEAGAEVKVKVGCDNQWLSLGNVTVYFETEEEYNARIESGSSEEEFTGFTADQQGTYCCSEYDSTSGFTTAYNLIVGANTVTYEYDDGYQEEMTLVSVSNGVYTYSLNGYSIVFSFTSDGNIAVSSDKLNDLDNIILTKEGSSGGGETDTTVYVVAGDNIVEISEKLGKAEITLNKVGVWTVTFGDDVQYIMVGNSPKVSGSTIEVTDTAVVITVYAAYSEKLGTYATPVTVNFTLTSGSGEEISSGSEGGETGTFAGFSAEQQGTYTTPAPNIYTYVIGLNTISTSSYGFDLEYTYVSLVEGVYTFTVTVPGEGKFTLTFSFDNDGNMVIASDTWNYLTKSTAVKEVSEESTGAKVGENTVQTGMAGSVEITFSVPGTYTLSYDSSADNVRYIEVGGVTVANGGKFTVTDSVTITVYANDNSMTSKFTIEVAQEESTVNKISTGDNLALGDNEITKYYDDYKAIVYLAASDSLPAGTYTLTFTGVWSGSLTVGGSPVADDGNGNATIEVTLGDTPIAIAMDNNNVNVTIKVAAKTTTEDSGSSEVGGADEGLGD